MILINCACILPHAKFGGKMNVPIIMVDICIRIVQLKANVISAQEVKLIIITTLQGCQLAPTQ